MSEDLWPHSPLSELSLAIKDGSHGTHKRVANGVPFLSAKNVAESGTLQWGDADDRISEEDYTAICSTFTPQDRDLLLTIVGTLGRRALFDGSHVAFQRSVAFVRPDARKILPRYLFHAAGSQDFGRQLVRRSNATAQAGLYLGELGKTTIPTPPPPDESPDQTLIAAVLDMVDEAIVKTEAVIEKLRQVRAGLLHDLLTRGLDHNGQLRDPIAHPEQFQDSPLGLIPKEWTAAPLRHFLSSAEYGISTSLSSEGSLPVLRMNNFSGGEASLDDVKFATCEVPKMLLLRDGDVLFNRTNSYEHVGRTGIWRGQLPVATFASYLVRLNPAPTRLTSEFLNLVLNMPESQQRMRRYATPAVQQVNINPTQLQLMHIAAPRLVVEQERIAVVGNESARPLVAETAELAKLESLKSGLMTDLLTGRVRVPETLGTRP
jgi:type I restriction enzyme, S subunit